MGAPLCTSPPGPPQRRRERRRGGGRGHRRPRRRRVTGEENNARKWILHDVSIEYDNDSASALAHAVLMKLGIENQPNLTEDTLPIEIVRRSFDARRYAEKKPRYRYTLRIDLGEGDSPSSALLLEQLRIRRQAGRVEPAPLETSVDMLAYPPAVVNTALTRGASEKTVIVVGAGPAGLMAALQLANSGVNVTLIERGQPVEKRGRDIGALFVRRRLNADSNLCFGEGGAGTWSDGKLTTRIGRNKGTVQSLLKLFADLGAPESIKYEGKPHLGTDRMVSLLRNLRSELESRNVKFRFGERVEELLSDGRSSVSGVRLHGGETVFADAVVLAIGHSARDLYTSLSGCGVRMSRKPFASGFRMEHPQSLVDELRYGKYAREVERGKGRFPVADYSYVHNNPEAKDVYSFCMCPGGQVVPSSTDPSHVCVNGMSFSKRNSRWANAAIVAQLDVDEMDHGTGPVELAGVRWQEEMEARAAFMGGGELVVPVQTMTDFLDGKLSRTESLPRSSYRLGVRAARLDLLYPKVITESIRSAIENIDSSLPGLLCSEGLLHGVETRTSSPVRIERDAKSFMSPSHECLFPCGEGAGYAGGIISAAVDGVACGSAVLAFLRAHREEN